MLRAILGVPEPLWRPAKQAALWHAAFVTAVTVVKSASNAVFLARADPVTLPLLYVAVALFVALTTALVGRALRKVPARRVLAAVVSGGAAAVALVSLACALELSGAPAALYVVGEAFATSCSVLLWTRVGEGFSSRDQRRVVGLIAAGGMGGAVLGGLGMHLLAPVLGALLPAGLIVALPVACLAWLKPLRAQSPEPGQKAAPRRSGARYLLSGAYPLGVAGLVVVLAATGAATDFAFRLETASALDEVSMAALFGLLNAAVGAAVVLVQAALTSRLLARFGIFAFAALVPAALLCLAVAAVLGAPSFEVLLLMRGVEMAGAFSLYQAAVTLLYNPMPSGVRGEVRALVDGTVKKGGAALAGLSLVGLALLDRRLVGPGLVAVLALCALALLPWLRRRYLLALEDKLGRRRRERPGGSTIDASDRETRTALLAALERDDAVVVLAALFALGEHELPLASLLSLLEHPDERVRQAALARVPAREDDALAERLVTLVRSDVARRPRGEAVRALARVSQQRLTALLELVLDDEDPGVVCAAIEAGWRGEAHERVEERLAELCTGLPSRPAAFRREVAHLLGVLGEDRYDAVLARLLDDDDPSVFALAALAAGRERHPIHLPRLLVALGKREERASARAALTAFGDEAVPALARLLDEKAAPLEQRVQVPRLLAAIGSDAAAQALLFSNPYDDAYLQRRIADRLVEVWERRGDLTVDRERTDAAVHRRLAAARLWQRALADLAGDDDAHLALLVRAVRERRDLALRIALQLTGLHRGLDRAMTVYRAVVGEGANARHDAIELLDAHLAGDPLRQAFLRVLEDSRPTGEPRSLLERVHRLGHSRDPLVRGIARVTQARLALSPPALSPHGEEDPTMTDATVERLFLLERVDLFAGLPTDDLAAIAAIATDVEVPAGEVLYAEGDVGDGMYVLVDGELELTRNAERVLRLHAGASLGQTSFLDRGPRPVTARVAGGDPARLLCIDRVAFLDLLSDRPGLLHALFAVLGQRLRALIDREAL